MSMQRVFAILVMAVFIFGCNNQSKEDLLRSGVELLNLGNTRGSIVYFKNALDKDPNYLEARYHLADAYLRSGRFVLAENEFRKVFQQNLLIGNHHRIKRQIEIQIDVLFINQYQWFIYLVTSSPG